MGQHRTLGPAGGARGVEQRGKVVPVPRHGGKGLGGIGGVSQAAPPHGVQRDHAGTGGLGGLAQRLLPGGVADKDLGLGIAQEIADLGGGVAGVQRQEHRARPQGGEIEDDRLNRFLDLNRHPVAGLDAQTRQRIGHAAAARDQVAIADALMPATLSPTKSMVPICSSTAT